MFYNTSECTQKLKSRNIVIATKCIGTTIHIIYDFEITKV